MRLPFLAVIGSVAVLGIAGAASATINLVQNGSFEASSVANPPVDWTIPEDFPTLVTATIQTTGAEDGINYFQATPGTSGEALNNIVQIITDTPGQEYTATAWTEFSGAPTDYSGNSPRTTLGVLGGNSETTAITDEGWTEQSFTFSGTGSDILLLNYGFGSGGTLGIDNVSVTAVPSPTPEPGTTVTLALGMVFLGGMVVVRRRKEPTPAA